jgi:Photosynthetic reaction centre cytochrome C subunit
MKKPFFVILGFILVISVSLAFTKDDPAYKNLKILPKHITKQQMDSVMHHFCASLSVRCNFCHVRNDSTKIWDFASDANPHKAKAREMMKMTDKINDKYFDVTGGKKTITTPLMVTCYTCHHGSTGPAIQPLMQERRQEQRPPADSTQKTQ